MSDEDSSSNVTEIPWSSVWTTGLVSAIQGVAFYYFFLRQRSKEQEKGSYDLYEPRHNTRKHRSPEPYAGSWWKDALAVTDTELLRCVGLDSYMFLRFLKLSTKICLLGSAFACLLIPLYGTGEERGLATVEFNQITLARIEENSSRLWATIFVWWMFIAYVLYLIVDEWKQFQTHRYDFLAKGDVDTPQAFRYAVKVEQIPQEYQSDDKLLNYFERLFPKQVLEASVVTETAELDKLVQERQANILKLEAAVAFTKAKPDKPQPQTKVKATAGVIGGTKVDAIDHFTNEIERLNKEIDEKRGSMKAESAPTTTGFCLMSSLRAKQAAVQCELSGDPDRMIVTPAPEPNGIIWSNVGTSLPRQKIAAKQAAAFFTVGILFWSVPVAFVTSIANLNGILGAIGLGTANPDAFWYGLVSGLLPVIFLAILMAVLYMAITAAATSFIKYKSMPEVDAYALFWHQCFQFANLWLILIGGSLFNQLDTLINEASVKTIVETIATAIPGASTFFVNIQLVAIGSMAMELSMLPTYGVKLIMKMIQPDAMRTQRQIDDDKKPPSIVWGQRVPPFVFVFLVAIIYMPIVPIMSIFGLIYFGVNYLVWKHQCLHVYAQEFEGGGEATWIRLFNFLMLCLYMGEIIFIAYMGIKEAPAQSAMGFVPFVVTILVHMYLGRKIIAPLRNLALEVAADVDIDEGELQGSTEKVYEIPSLNPAKEEREAQPYRREKSASLGGEKPAQASEESIEAIGV